MSISEFSEIPDLWCEYNAGIASTVAASGTTVTAFSCNAGTNSGFSLATVGTTAAAYDPAVHKVGELAGIHFPANTDAKVQGEGLTPPGAAAPWTFIVALKNDSIGDGDYGFCIRKTGDSLGIDRSGNFVSIRAGNSTKATSVARTTDPTIVIATCDGPSAGNVKIYVNNIDSGYVGTANVNDDWERVIIGNNWNNVTDSLGGVFGLLAAWPRVLTAQEQQDAYDLANYWVLNGEAPSAGPSGTFGVVATNDDLSVTAWQWEESADGVGWANVGTILTDTTGATTTELTVNSAPIEVDQTQVRVRATSAKEPAGVLSATATLTVTA